MNRTINKSIKKFQTFLSFSQLQTKQSKTRITKRAKSKGESLQLENEYQASSSWFGQI
jgi:hypothetical protein